MFLFCNWFNKLIYSKVFRNDTEQMVDEILNQTGEEE